MTFPGDVLWATQVDIDGITVGFDNFCGGEKLFGIVGAELDDQRPVLWISFLTVRNVKILVAVSFPRPFCEHLVDMW